MIACLCVVLIGAAAAYAVLGMTEEAAPVDQPLIVEGVDVTEYVEDPEPDEDETDLTTTPPVNETPATPEPEEPEVTYSPTNTRMFTSKRWVNPYNHDLTTQVVGSRLTMKFKTYPRKISSDWTFESLAASATEITQTNTIGITNRKDLEGEPGEADKTDWVNDNLATNGNWIDGFWVTYSFKWQSGTVVYQYMFADNKNTGVTNFRLDDWTCSNSDQSCTMTVSRELSAYPEIKIGEEYYFVTSAVGSTFPNMWDTSKYVAVTI